MLQIGMRHLDSKNGGLDIRLIYFIADLEISFLLAQVPNDFYQFIISSVFISMLNLYYNATNYVRIFISNHLFWKYLQVTEIQHGETV